MEQSYKEKYEDILARLERAKNDNEVCDERFCCVINEIIPELAESEDEQIRKWIINEIKIKHHNLDEENVDFVDKAIAWLERQGEHANFLSKIQVGDKVTRNENGVLVNLSQLKRVAKPVDKIEPKFKVGDKIYLKPEYRMPDDDTPIANTVKEIRRIDDKHYRFDGSYIFIEDQDKYELVEQKVEENNGNIVGISSNPEWSEEDEQHVDSLLKRLDALCRNKFERTRFAISEDRDWLKSLRPQNRWKPTDEQIAQLQIAVDTYGNEGIYDPILTELLFQLKKLKEGKI